MMPTLCIQNINKETIHSLFSATLISKLEFVHFKAEMKQVLLSVEPTDQLEDTLFPLHIKAMPSGYRVFA